MAEELKQVGIAYNYKGYLIELDLSNNNFRAYDEENKVKATSTKGYKTKCIALSKAQNLINILEDDIAIFFK